MMSTTQAMPITAGTNTLRTLSARELNGTLAAAVVCTVCTSWAAVESGPMRVARQTGRRLVGGGGVNSAAFVFGTGGGGTGQGRFIHRGFCPQ